MRNDFFDQTENSMPRIGDYAPAFRSVTTQGTIYFPADYFGKWVILFSFPFDSTPESVSELVILNTMHNDLKALNCELVGLPVDLQTRFTTGLHPLKEKIKFPLIENNITEVARKYGIIQPSERNSKAVRSVFFIDPECMIRGVINYPMSLGLNFDELKRVIVGLQTVDEKCVKTITDRSSGNETIFTGNYFN
jgi:peroxiredoxin (alkyl hydroperoxide reductase subunit C)